MEPAQLSRRACLMLLSGGAAAGLLAACGGAASVGTTASSAAPSSSAAAVSSSATSASSTVRATTSRAATSSAATSSAVSSAKASSSAAAASVSATPKPGTVRPAPGTLDWWPGWPGTYMRDIANAFMKENPTIKVEPVLFYPDNTKLVAAIVAGTGPDVVSDIGYYNFIERGLVLPLDDKLKTEKISTTNGDIRAANWNAFHWKGKYYGIPAVDTAGRQALGINVDMAQAAGLDPSKPPQTWDDMLSWNEKLTKFDSAGNVTQSGFDPLYSRANATSDGDTWMWPEMWGFHYFDVNTMKYSIDRPETIDFYGVIQKFYNLVPPAKLSTFYKPYTKSYGAFGAGKQAMAITYPSGPGRIHNIYRNSNTTYRWTYPPMPTNRKGITVQAAAGHAQLLVQGSKLVDQAFKLMLYLPGKTASDILFDQVGWVGPSKSWQKTMDLSKFPKDVQQGIQFFTTSLDEAKEVWTPDFDPEDEYLGGQWRMLAKKVNAHTMDPKTAVQQLQFIMDTRLKADSNYFKAG